MFLYANVEEFKNHVILPDLWSPSDHTLLSIYIIIIIKKKTIQDYQE